jgi:hypothetical protein
MPASVEGVNFPAEVLLLHALIVAYCVPHSSTLLC